MLQLPSLPPALPLPRSSLSLFCWNANIEEENDDEEEEENEEEGEFSYLP
jgi:hypothetical protein